MKCYPTYDLAGLIFGVDKAQINRWVNSLRVILEKALGKAMVLPERQIKSMKEFIERFPDVKELIIDGTERPISRPKDKQKQKECYSGKKKRHTRKNIIAVSRKKEILFVSPSVGGREHDYPTLKKSKFLESIPKEVETYCDLGFKGIEKAYSLKINIPIRKPRTRELTKEEREYNKKVSGYRVKVENAIAGVKRLRVITDVSRMRDEKLNDH
jgi:ribosomal protein L44E